MLNAPITYGSIKDGLHDFLKKKCYHKIAILVDENTEKYCLPLLPEFPFHVIQINSGEANKNIDTCQYIWEQLLINHFTRHDLLINLGGGVINDMGAFAASCFKRGMAFINIPTTLLAMVDATVGGKTGIDFMNQKNMIGLFATPQEIFVDEHFLNTLPQRHIVNGKAEMLKHGLIANEKHFNKVLNESISLDLIKESIAIKQQIVEQDPFEKGVRKTLNFGHTLGHAYESYALQNDLDVLHGEAIAQGMIWVLKLSVEFAHFSKEKANEILNTLQNIYGKVLLNNEDLKTIISLALNDKKNNDSQISFVLLKDIAEPLIDIKLSEEQIVACIANM